MPRYQRDGGYELSTFREIHHIVLARKLLALAIHLPPEVYKATVTEWAAMFAADNNKFDESLFLGLCEGRPINEMRIADWHPANKEMYK